jgi:MFS family permease
LQRVQIQRRSLRVLVGAQILGGAGFFLGFAVSVLLARELTGTEALVGLPVAIAVAAAAVSARPLGAWMQRAGRRPGLAAGQLCGAGGAVVILVAARVESFPLFCVGMAAFGVGNSSNLLARYAASDLAAAEGRARAISAVLLATAAGAILGPNLAEAAGGLGNGLGVSDKAAPFAVSAVLLALAASVLWLLLRPDPLLIARRLDAGDTGGEPQAAGPRLRMREWPRMALVGAGAIVLANAIMISIMTVTPLHLDDAGQSLGVVGLVISLHVSGMFLPSPLSGALADRYGRLPVIAASGAVLLLAGGLAAPTTGHHAAPVIVALALLGIGWNLGLVGGSALLTDSIPLSERARAQGQADFAMGMAGAGGSLVSGPVLHLGGYALIGIAGAFLGAALVLMAIRAGLFAPAPAEAG